MRTIASILLGLVLTATAAMGQGISYNTGISFSEDGVPTGGSGASGIPEPNSGTNARIPGAWLDIGPLLTGGGVVVTNAVTFQMNATTTTNFAMNIGAGMLHLGRSMIYLSETNEFPFDKTITASIYSATNYPCDECVYRNIGVRMYGVMITNAIAAGATNILVTDASGFAANDLVYISGSNEFRRVLATSTGNIMLECPVSNPHSTTCGVSKVSELDFNHFIPTDGNNTLYGKVVFPSPSSPNLTFRTVYKK